MRFEQFPGNPGSFRIHAENLTAMQYGGYRVDVVAFDDATPTPYANSYSFGIGIIPEPSSVSFALLLLAGRRRRRVPHFAYSQRAVRKKCRCASASVPHVWSTKSAAPGKSRGPLHGSAILITAYLAVGCARPIQQATSHPSQDRPVAEAVAYLSGGDSQITQQSFFRVSDAAQWQELWLEHLGQREVSIYQPKFEVDFSRSMVIAIFNGKATNTCGIEVCSIHESEQSILIRYEVEGYQTITGLSTTPSEDGDSIPDNAFAFIVLPRSDRTVILDEDQHSIIGDPPRWVEVARLKQQ